MVMELVLFSDRDMTAMIFLANTLYRTAVDAWFGLCKGRFPVHSMSFNATFLFTFFKFSFFQSYS